MTILTSFVYVLFLIWLAPSLSARGQNLTASFKISSFNINFWRKYNLRRPKFCFKLSQEVNEESTFAAKPKMKWDKVFKNGPSKICGRQFLTTLSWFKQTIPFQSFDLSQIILGPFLNTFAELAFAMWSNKPI